LSSFVVISINTLKSSNLTGASPEILIEYMAILFLSTLAINFIKGLMFPGVTAAYVIGMILGIVYFGSAISTMAPDTVLEVICYIIAASAGIYLGTQSHSRGGRY
jgi:uncharacterized membrane protein SpoIIM required for sporulation